MLTRLRYRGAFQPELVERRRLLLLVALALVAQAVPAQPEQAEGESYYVYPREGAPLYLYVNAFGRGDTVVVLHGGWGAEHSYLLDAVEGLEDEYHFVFYDQRGSLRSPIADSLVDRLISVGEHLDDLDLIRRELGLERMNLLAHSMGTFLAMAYLEAYPERVGGLILLGALPPKTPTTPQDSTLYREQEQRGQSFVERPAVEAEVEEEGLDRGIRELSGKERTHQWRIRFAGANLYHVERWREMGGGMAFYNGYVGQAASRTMPERYDFIPVLERHPRPVAVVLGDHDYVDMGGRAWRPVAASMPNVDLHTIEEAGHVPWIDQPQAFRKTLAQALANSLRSE